MSGLAPLAATTCHTRRHARLIESANGPGHLTVVQPNKSRRSCAIPRSAPSRSLLTPNRPSPIVGRVGSRAGRGKSRTACETQSNWATEARRHRELLGFLCVSVTPWQTSLCLAARADFHHGLLGVPECRAAFSGTPGAGAPGASLRRSQQISGLTRNIHLCPLSSRLLKVEKTIL